MNTNSKLRACLTIILTFVMGWMYADSITLPGFKTKDDIADKVISDLTSFAQTTGDFTLEAKAKAGVAITLKFGNISYTPSADGIVRFVQQAGKVYVFENNVYTSTLTPNYIYSEQKANIIRNGSFETVSEQLSSGRWKASDWETWDGGTPTWGGDVGYVNVRENANYRSDGTKSLILHSRSRWLCQQLTDNALEANALYKFSCDYWTSEGGGNGNGKYLLSLGSALVGNDLLEIDAYTTLEGNNSKQSFATVLQAPASLPKEVFLSLYRAESKVDWLDNVKLVKIVPEHIGIEGTSEARYCAGAYAPQNMVLPEGTHIDMTSVIVNPNFDNGTMVKSAPTGWTLDAPATQSKISTGEKWSIIAANQNHWQIWQDGSALKGRAYQTITNIPNGRYSLSADVCCTGFSGSISLYANYGKTAVISNSGKHYTTTGVVVDGTLELGLAFATTGGVTVDFDSFTLQYLGMDIEGYRETLQIKIKEAEQTLTKLEAGYDATPISNAVNSAKAVADDASADDIIAAIATINKAIADYNIYVEKINAERKNKVVFEALVKSAKKERTTDTYPGTADFDKAIANAEAFLAQLEANSSLSITEASDALNAAREAYYNSQYTIQPKKQVVSTVDLSLNGSEKYTLRVDGNAFYPTAIQVRGDKLRGYIGWSEAEIEATFKRAAEDGFNTLSVPLFWSEVELEKNHFDWRILDRYLGWCKKYGTKMEILWFSWSSGGRVQYLWNYNGKQVLRTPDYVCSKDGKSEFNMLRDSWEYSLNWRDANLRSRDAYVLGRIMDHVALWDANNGNNHTVVGVQLGNEARAHGGNTATSAEIIDYYHHVGAAVKNSLYSTWTRLNCVSYETSGRTSANESKRNNGGTNIDFVGIDIYGTNAGKVKGNMDGQLGANGKNYRMIMEIDAKDGNSPLYQMAALAGDKAFDYYNLGPVDGNGLYANDGHKLTERSHISLVRQRNKILNLANQDIALRSHGNGLYVFNYAGNSTNSENGLAGISFKPNFQTTQAIAVRHSSSEIVLLTTASGKFTIPSSLNVTSAQTGYFDKNNRWVKTGDANYADGVVTFSNTGCVLLTMNGKEDDNKALVLNGEFNEGTSGWTNTTNAATYKVSTAAKGDGSVIWADGGHLQLWSGSAISGKVFQNISVPNGKYTLTAGLFATFGGTVYLYANNEKVAVESNKNAYYKVVVEVTDGNLQVGLDINTTGGADIEFDHVVLTPGEADVPQPVKRRKVFTIGDSTMANKSSNTERGWGMLFPTFVDGNFVTVSNNAADGRSTKSFISEGRWTTVVNQLQEGDYVLIQFGHNDEKTDGSLHTDPQTTYKANLKRFVTETQAKGAKAVLLTPIVRRIFGADGNIYDEHTEYANAVRELATELNVPLIDMNLYSCQYENIAGIVGSRSLHEYFLGTEIDNTHLCQLGAYITARCVAEQIAQDADIDIAINKAPAALDGAYTSTLDYAQHAFAASYPDEKVPATLDAIDAKVRQLRHDARQALATAADGTDATFALVNPDFAEGFCWYNAVQATRPMGWNLDRNTSGQENVMVKTAEGVTYFIVWAATMNYIDMSQKVSDLPNGAYEITAKVKASKGNANGGTWLYATTAAGSAKTNATTLEAWEPIAVRCNVTDGTLTLGLRSESGWYARLADVRLTKVDSAISGISSLTSATDSALQPVYDLQGRKLANTHAKGIYIVGGKKVVK